MGWVMGLEIFNPLNPAQPMFCFLVIFFFLLLLRDLKLMKKYAMQWTFLVWLELFLRLMYSFLKYIKIYLCFLENFYYLCILSSKLLEPMDVFLNLYILRLILVMLVKKLDMYI